MPEITAAELEAYLEDHLDETEQARVEKALRDSPALQGQLRELIEAHGRGEHSVGSIWRQERLTCPSREQLSNYLLGVLETAPHGYITFHLDTIGCVLCRANLADLQTLQREPPSASQQRCRRIVESSAGILDSVRRPRA